MGTIILFILVLSLLVFVHELGHFWVARRMGMKVEEFGFGFPPRLFGIKRKGTLYSINWIPLGGFVKIKGESGDHADDGDSFASKKPWQRFLVLIAGVVMNLFLAAVLFSIGYMAGLPSVIDDMLPESARVAEQTLTVMQVIEGSPAQEAGVVAGDSIALIDGQLFVSDEVAREYLATNGEQGVELTLVNEVGEERVISATSEYLDEAESSAIGIGFVSTGLVSYPFFQAIGQGVYTTVQYTVEITKAFGSIIRDLVVTQEVGVDLSGPVGIAVMTGQVAAMGLVYLLQFTAILSINLAIINILPFPALDGGRIFFLAIEKIRGRAVNEKIEIAAHNLGFILLMALVVLVTYKDFVTFGDSILGAIRSWI
ncbi:MAG: RIP metalloprotease RseP [bacterium]|jgi:regulator of sigma E protease|nr:RIP metalloprotease RseP [bacterium]